MSKSICPLESPLNFLRNLTNRDLLARFVQKLRNYKDKFDGNTCFEKKYCVIVWWLMGWWLH